MKFYKDVFCDGFNTDLTVNTLGIVLFNRFHIGLDFNPDNITVIVQLNKKNYFFTIGNKAYQKRME